MSTSLEELKLTPWDSDNDTAITKSSVDYQDESSVDDLQLTLDGLSKFGKQLVNSGKQLTTQGSVGQVINLFAKEKTSLRPDKTDAAGPLDASIKAIKNKKYKNISLSSKIGLYNSFENLVGISSGLYVGTLGKSWGENLGYDAISIVTKSYPKLNFLTPGATVAVRYLKTKSEEEKNDANFSSLDIPTQDLVNLSIANYYTILSTKPGLTIRAHGGKTEYITNEYKGAPTDIISNENFEKFKNNFKFIHKINSSDEENNEYDTGTVINNDGVLISSVDTQIEETIINSKIRKEVQIKPKIGIFETLEDFELYQQGDEEKLAPTSAEEEFPRVTKAMIFNRVNSKYREIGGLYIEPFYSNGILNCYEIPFEFNPTITENASTATYAKEELLGRIISLKSYVNSDAGDVSIEATYFATSDGNADFIANDGWKSGWMYDWNIDKLKKIEKQYRSLTLPYIENSVFIRPPIVRIKFRSTSSKQRTAGEAFEDDSSGLTVGDLFRYPSLGDNKIQITKNFDGETRDKRYIVTSVQISPLEHFGNSYVYSVNDSAFNTVNRNGFKVTINLAETTKNFLDLIPSYAQYAGITDETNIQYVDVPYNPKFINEDGLDLWSCLNHKLKFCMKYVNDTSKYPILFHDEDAHYITDYDIEYKSEEDLENPNKNTSKEFSEYYDELVAIGKSTADIIKMLYNTNWSNREDYINWMYGDTRLSLYNECDNNFITYMKLVESAGLSLKNSEEFKTKIQETNVWKNSENFKDYFINAEEYSIKDYLDFGLDFKDYVETIKQKYPSKLKDIFVLYGTKYNKPGTDFVKWLKADRTAKYTSYDTFNGNFKSFVDTSGITSYNLYDAAKSGKWKDSTSYKEWRKQHVFDVWLKDYYREIRESSEYHRSILIKQFLNNYEAEENIKLEEVSTRYSFYNSMLKSIFESGNCGQIMLKTDDKCYYARKSDELIQFINDQNIFVHISDTSDSNYNSNKNIIKILRDNDFSNEQIFLMLCGDRDSNNVIKTTSIEYPPKYPEGYRPGDPIPEDNDYWEDFINDASVQTLVNYIKSKYKMPKDVFLTYFSDDLLNIVIPSGYQAYSGLGGSDSGGDGATETIQKSTNIGYILDNVPETDNSDFDNIIQADNYALRKNIYAANDMGKLQEQLFYLFFKTEENIKNIDEYKEE